MLTRQWSLSISLWLCCSTWLYGQPDVKTALDKIMEEEAVPGTQVGHLRNGQKAAYGVGEARYGSGDSITSHHLFQAASLSKVVFAYAVLRLYDRGVIDIDKPLLDYMPYERMSEEPRGKQMTARMVLDHTTGLPNWQVRTSDPNWETSKLKAAFEPGKNFRYSGEGFYWLQRVVEHLTHQSLQQLVEAEVFEPLGMAHSSYSWKDSMQGSGVVGHNGLEPYQLRKVKNANAAFSLLTTADEYLTFVVEGLLKGQGLKSETHAMMLTPSSSAQPVDKTGKAYDHLSYGLGVLIQENERGKAVIHTGSNPGFRNFFIAYPETGEVLVFFANGTNGGPIRDAVARLFLGDQTFWFTQR